MVGFADVKEVKIDIKVAESQLTATLGGMKVYGSDDSYYKILKSEVDDPEEFAKGFLHGALYIANLQLSDVVFHPADSIEHTNTPAKPVYCFEYKGLGGEDYYEFETHFSKKQ